MLVLGVVLAGCAQTAGAPKAEESTGPGFYTSPQAQRGRSAYLARCAHCHTETLVGRPPAPPLRGTGFMARWDGKTVGDLYSRIRTTMPNDAPGSLSRGDTLDIVAYLFQANGLPEGSEELAGSLVELKKTRIAQRDRGGD